MSGFRVVDGERARICELRTQGKRVREIVAVTGRSKATVERVLAAAGGLPPRRLGRPVRCLSLEDREEISRGLAAGDTFGVIATRLGRAASTVGREVKANGGRAGYRAWAAERRAYQVAARPKQAKLAASARLRGEVEARLSKRWSPQQIAQSLRIDYPDQPEMWVSHETIYQSLFVQGRGALRKELAACLRTGRAQRRPRALAQRAGVVKDMVLISDRPAEIEDRAVPGHWEGDLIIGKNGRSAIGTLVERHTRLVMLIHLPDGHTAEQVRVGLANKVQALPAELRRSITWDQGSELAQHAQFSVDTGVDVYFCDPHSPWQRGSNENTNGLLRQYFPKGTDLSVHSADHLDAVARELNERPRQTLGWMKPSEKFADLLAATA